MSIKIKSAVLLLAFITGTAFAKAPTGVEVCSKDVPFKQLYDDGEVKTQLKGLCVKKGSNEKWLVDPLFHNLSYSQDSKIFYGWKYNDPTGNLDFNRTKKEAEQYGHISSVLFNADGSKRVEIPGRIESFKNGYGNIMVSNNGGRITVLGMDASDIQNNSSSKAIAMGYIGLDMFLNSLSYTVQQALLINQPLYTPIHNKIMQEQFRVGFIDSNGAMIIKPQFVPSNLDTTFEPNYAVVMNEDRKFGLINKKSDFILEPKFNGIIYQKLYGKSRKQFNLDYVFVTVENDCSLFSCKEKKQILSPNDLKVLDAFDRDYSKFFIMKVIKGEQGFELTEQNFIPFLIGMILTGAIILWPLSFAYQKFKKKASLSKSIFAGLGWSFVLSAVAIVGTVFVLCLFVLMFFSMNILGVVMAQED